MIETLAAAAQPYWTIDWGAAFISLFAMGALSRKFKLNKADITG